MYYIFLLSFFIQIVSCGSNDQPVNPELGSMKVQTFCSINTNDRAWQQGHYVAKSACEQGTLGEIKPLCNRSAQQNCIAGIIAYLQSSPCGASPKLRNPQIHAIMCPLAR